MSLNILKRSVGEISCNVSQIKFNKIILFFFRSSIKQLTLTHMIWDVCLQIGHFPLVSILHVASCTQFVFIAVSC